MVILKLQKIKKIVGGGVGGGKLGLAERGREREGSSF